jgi:membrane protein DedA with SNARE-associated domain
MQHFLDVLKSWGPLGVFALAMVESMGIPNPGGTDFLLLFIAAVRPEQAMLAAWLAVAGSLLGSAVFYEITRKGGEALLARYTSSGRGQRFRTWFLRYGLITVFIPAFLPIPILPFKAFAACAGAMGVRRSRFFLVLALARVPRYIALAYLGSQLGENAGPWLRGHAWHLLTFAVVLTAALVYVVRRANRETLQYE